MFDMLELSPYRTAGPDRLCRYAVAVVEYLTCGPGSPGSVSLRMRPSWWCARTCATTCHIAMRKR